MSITSLKPVIAGAVACLAAALVLYGCPQAITLNLRVSPEGGGTATAAPDQASYPAGAVVQLTATPAEGWRFNRWEGLVVDPYLASTTITMDSSQTVTAVFQEILKQGYTLRIEVAPSSDLANVTLDPPPDPATRLYRPGAVVTLTVQTSCCPNGGQFVRWEGSVTAPNLPVTQVTMNDNQTVRAVIHPQGAPEFAVDFSAMPEGAGIVTVSPQQDIFFAGEQAGIEATAAPGYNFAFWIGDVSDIIDPATTFTANKDGSVIAFFKPVSGVSDDPHAYLFGIPEGPLADQIQQQFPNVVTEVGSAARGLVMPGSAVELIQNNATDADALNALFDAGFPIILAAVTSDQIAALEQILGVAPGGIDLEPGESLLAYFGIDQEPDGKAWRIVGHMPQPGDTDLLPDNGEWRRQCISTLEAWVLKDNHRAEDFAGVDEAAAAAVKQTYDNLVELAKADPLQTFYFFTYSDTGKSDAFSLTTFPYSCHSLTGSGMDYFYIAQYGTFSGSGSYKYTECSQFGGYGSGSCDSTRYLYRYRMWTAIPGLDPGSSNVTLYGPSPATYSGENPIATSEIAWSIGGSVGIDTATGPSFEFTAGVQVTNAYTISIPDVSILFQATGFNQPQWTYDIRRTWECKDDLCGPPLVAKGTFAPVNQWLYVVQPSLRNTFPNGLPLQVSIEAKQASDRIDCDVLSNYSTYCTLYQSTSKTMNQSQSFTVPWPPAVP